MKQETILQVEKWNYGKYSSENYGAHSIAIKLGARKVYFSYDTLVAFKGYDSKGNYYFCVHKNEWGNTTGKHLNIIDGGTPEAKKQRLNEEEFSKQLNKFLK